jgi:hypothetical protein
MEKAEKIYEVINIIVKGKGITKKTKKYFKLVLLQHEIHEKMRIYSETHKQNHSKLEKWDAKLSKNLEKQDELTDKLSNNEIMFIEVLQDVDFNRG